MNIDNKPILYSLFLTSIQSIAGVFIVIGVYLLCDRFLNIQKDNIKDQQRRHPPRHRPEEISSSLSLTFHFFYSFIYQFV